MGIRRFVMTPVPVYVALRSEAEEWLEKLYENAENGVGFDTETSGLDVVRDRIRFFSLAQEDCRLCFPVRLLPVMAPILEDPDVPKHMTNAKFDQHMASNHGILVQGHCQDTADQDFLLDENRLGRHGLKQCAADYLGLRMTSFKNLFGQVRGVREEIETLGEVHQILEQYDHDGEKKEAVDQALKLLVRLKKVKAEAKVLKDVKKLELSLRGGCTLDARKVLKIARDHGFANKTLGKGGYVSDFVNFLAGYELPDQAAREAHRWMLDSQDILEEFHTELWTRMLTLIDAQGNPIERLRTIVMDYASLDAWASFMLVDHLREELADEYMIREDQAQLAEDFSIPIELLFEAKENAEDDKKRDRLDYLLEGTIKRLEAVEDEIEKGQHDQTLYEFSEENRVPFIRTLWNMERRGFRINIDTCRTYAEEMQEEIEQTERAIVKETGDLNFSPTSTPDVRAAVFECRNGVWEDPFGHPPKKMTAGGENTPPQPSTAKAVLEEFAGKGHALSKLILEHRRMSKLRSTYMVALPEHADIRDRIHTSLKSTGAVTWRLSSAKPNLQNIPSRDPVWGQRIRRLFVAGLWGDCDPNLCLPEVAHIEPPDLPPDFPMTLIVADYKQLEMRIMAHFSRDEGMIDAILRDRDLHCQTVALASSIGAIDPGITYDIAFAAKKAKNPDQDQIVLLKHRGDLKATGFGILYGVGALKLGMQLGLPIVTKSYRNGTTRDTCPAAEKLTDDYLNRIYPGVGQAILDTHEMCRENRAVYTIAGHPRRLPNILSNNRRLRAQAERQANNSRIQGSAADITNRAMLRCEKSPVLRRLGVRQLLQIHDELVFEVPDHPDFIEPAKAEIKSKMENPYNMLVPIEIDMDVAHAWGDAKG